MKTKTWILLFAVLVLVCVALSFFLLRKQNADSVKVISDGEVKYVLPLSRDTPAPPKNAMHLAFSIMAASFSACFAPIVPKVIICETLPSPYFSIT